jgi:hypothetical protein
MGIPVTVVHLWFLKGADVVTERSRNAGAKDVG